MAILMEGNTWVSAINFDLLVLLRRTLCFEEQQQTIDMKYKESKRTDQYGNQFRYRTKVKNTRGAKLERWAWDVFLVSGK